MKYQNLFDCRIESVVMTLASLREPAMQGRTRRFGADQSESDRIISLVYLSDLDRLQLWITHGRYTKTDTFINKERAKTESNREREREVEIRPCKLCLKLLV